MVNVPSYDNFKVNPNVQPVGAVNVNISEQASTFGAQELIRGGEDLLDAGSRVASIQLDATNTANQLRIDDSLNQLKEATLEAQFNPDTGYTNIKGINALQRPDGRSLTAEYTDMLDKRASAIENSLANDAQKAAFRTNANNLITSFGGSVQAHESQEFQTYALSVRDGTISNRMTEIGLNYNNPEVTDEAIQSIAAATYDKARLLGQSAEWAEAQTREMTSKAHSTAIKAALQNTNVTYADMYMKKYASAMEPDDILGVNGLITKELDNKIGVDTASKVIEGMGPKIETSNSDRAFNIALGTESNHQQFAPDGVTPLTSSAGAIGIAQVMPATGPEAAKLAGLEWDETKFRTDAKYNATIGKAYFDKQLRDNGGNLSMAYAAYNAGPGALQNAIKEAEKEGKPQDWVTYLPRETQDYVQKNMKAYGAGAGQYAKPSLYELQKQVRDELGNSSPERLKIALAETERQYNQITAATKQRNEDAVANAMRGVIQNGGRYSDLPPDIRGSVAPEDVTKVMDFAKRISLGDDTSSMYLYQELSAQPDKMKNMSDAQFFALQSELSQADFKHFAEIRGKLISGVVPNGPGDVNSKAVTRALNDRLTSMGIDPAVKYSKDEDAAQRVGAIRRYVDQSLAAEQLNRNKKMNDVEVSAYIDTLFAQQGVVEGFFSDSTVPLLGKEISDIPSSTKDALKNAFKRQGIDEPSDTDLLNAYWRQVSLTQKQKAQNGG